jgi:hypothetical protein
VAPSQLKANFAEIKAKLHNIPAPITIQFEAIIEEIERIRYEMAVNAKQSRSQVEYLEGTSQTTNKEMYKVKTMLFDQM